jgi:hemolysin III
MSLSNHHTRNEELANAVSHLAGAGFAAAGLVLMIVFSDLYGDFRHIISTGIFGTTMLVTYLASGLAHALRSGKVKDFFFTIDRISIFMLIAGTYTPISLIAIKGTLGWILLCLEWGMAAAGILLTFIRPGRSSSRVSFLFIGLYTLMGWLIVVAIVPVIQAISLTGFIWILIGGIFYTGGIFFYSLAKFPYYHLVWHLMVIAGSLSHFLAIFYYLIPSK